MTQRRRQMRIKRMEAPVDDCSCIQDSPLKLVSQGFLENIVPLHYLMMRLLVISIFLKLVVSAPYEPGQPGGEWTAEEIDIVRGKVIPYFSIFSQNKFPLLLMEKSITLISNFKVTI